MELCVHDYQTKTLSFKRLTLTSAFYDNITTVFVTLLVECEIKKLVNVNVNYWHTHTIA